MANDPKIIAEMLRLTNEAYLAGYDEFEKTLSECHRIDTSVSQADIKSLKEEINRLMPVAELAEAD